MSNIIRKGNIIDKNTNIIYGHTSADMVKCKDPNDGSELSLEEFINKYHSQSEGGGETQRYETWESDDGKSGYIVDNLLKTCRQWGQTKVQSTQGSLTITLFKPYKNIYYNIQLSQLSGNSNNRNMGFYVRNGQVTTNSFVIYEWNLETGTYWMTFGFIP